MKGLVPALALGLAACLPDFDARSSIVREARVLAVIAEPPEARPGASVRYEALAVSPDGREERAPIAWTLCTIPTPSAENNAVAAACQLQPTPPFEPRGSRLTAAVSLDACARFGPDPPPGDARPRDPDGTGGYYQPVVAFAHGESYLHLERLLCNPRSSPADVARDFAARYVPNENPRPPELELRSADGDPIDDGIPGGSSLDLALRIAPGSAEEYVWIDPRRGTVGARSETLLVSWFATDGVFAVDRNLLDEGAADDSASNRWTAPERVGRAVLWVVLRDDRGGSAFIERELDIVD